MASTWGKAWGSSLSIPVTPLVVLLACKFRLKYSDAEDLILMNLPHRTMAILGCVPGYLEFLGTPENGAKKCYTDYVAYCKIPMAHPTSFPFTCSK